MEFELQDKVALITGADAPDGIGAAIAARFAEAGARVICSGIVHEKGEQLAEHIRTSGGHATYIQLDVTRENDWQSAVAYAVSDCGGLDILVNNAGLLLLAPLTELTLDDWRRTHTVNVEGAFLGIKHAVLAMKPNGGAGKGGSIINISSVAATTGAANHTAYGSSKAAVSALTRHAANECAASGIRVNAICPGIVKTGMLINTPENIQKVNELHLFGLGDPGDIAAAALYLAGDASRWVTGIELVVDGGLKVKG